MAASQARNVVVFGATGAIAGAVAEEFAGLGDRLFLSSRASAAPAALRGKAAEWARVDACDQREVEGYFAALLDKGVTPDIVFNGIGVRAADGGFGAPSSMLEAFRFNQTLAAIVGGQFLTASRGAEVMARQGRGVVILLSSSLAKASIANMAGITAASDAVEGLARVLEAEYRAAGVRVFCARLGAMPETRMIRETMSANARTIGVRVEDYAAALAAARAGGSPLSLRAGAKAIALLASVEAAPLVFEPINVGLL